MTGPGSFDRASDREKIGALLSILVAALVILAAFSLWLPPARTAEAQDQLTLDDFDTTGLEIDLLALIQVGYDAFGDNVTVYRAPPRTPAVGTLLDGELGLSSVNEPISSIRFRSSDGAVTINDSGDLLLRDYFSAGGDGADLTLRVQTTAGTGQATSLLSQGGNFATFNMDSDAHTLLNGLADGDRFIVAFTRDAPSEAPGQVTGVNATADDYDSVTVSWNAVANADGYVVQWDDDSAFGSASEATISSGSTVTHQITGLTEHTAYYVRVYATRTVSDDGAVSDVASATTELQPPAQVTGLRATAASSTSIDVAWDAAARADGYTVIWRVVGTGSYTEATTTSTSHTITGLTENTMYTVRVQAARTGADPGQLSDLATLMLPLTPPAQVTGVMATAGSSSSIDVSWDAANLADGYTIEWGTASGSYSDDDTSASTSHSITGLSASTTYYLRVTATRTGADDGTPSVEHSATTEPGTLPPPGQVMGLNLSGDGYDSITASWSPVADADGYVLQWDDDSAFGSSNEATISSGATVTHQLTGLQEDTTYHVRARATRTGATDGDWSTTASAATTLQSPAQVMMVATAASDVAVTVTWANAVRADGYRIEWGTTSGSYTESATTTGLSYNITGLNPSTTHYLRVVSTRTGASDGRPSAEASATTDAALTPAPVTGLSVTAISDRELRVTWAAAANATGYVVQWDTDDTFPDPGEARASGTGVIIERLRAETEYHVRVQGARAGATDGAYSTSASATTGDAQTRVWAERFPGGAIAAQLALSAFGGVMAGVRFKSMKSPRREAVITGAMSLGALILPAFGLANEFWVIGVALLVLLASIAAIFLARR